MPELTPRAALQKAAITTSTASAAMLDPEQSTQLFRVLQEKTVFGSRMRQVTRRASSGEINKITTGRRIIRRAVENDDDGYRAEPSFPTVPYQTVKVRLPWEITEDTLHENIEGQNLEATVEAEMTDAWAADLEDLAFNGDTAVSLADPDAAFIGIDDGWIKLIVTNAPAERTVDGSTISAGAFEKAHLFAMAQAMPNRYRQGAAGPLVFLMSPARRLDWIEYRTDRDTAAGDEALGGGGDATNRPLGYEIVEVPSMPDDIVILTPTRNLVRVITWEVRRRKVTGETDWGLANTDKRGYIFFFKMDHIVDEYDAAVILTDLDAIA